MFLFFCFFSFLLFIFEQQCGIRRQLDLIVSDSTEASVRDGMGPERCWQMLVLEI